MSKKANPTMIGLFILGGLALGVAGIFLFSSTRWFTRTSHCILYFDGSLAGLNPGAPVKYRGVTVGSVRKVMIRFNQATNDYQMPVLIEVREDLVRDRLGDPLEFNLREFFQRGLEQGLRGSLQSESLVTGLLYLELERRPEVKAVYHQLKPIYTEIPTMPTDVQQLFNKLARLDFQGITDKLSAILDKLDADLSQIHVREISQGLTNILASVNQLVKSPSITNSLTSVQRTVDEFGALSAKIRGRVDPLADDVSATLKQTQQTLAELREGVQDLRDAVAPDASLRQALTQALQQIGDAARSLAVLSDFLTRNPNALLTGRKRPEPSK
jgi:paraquat-inducible protein B